MPQLSGAEARRELVLKGGVGGEIGISQVAKAQINVAIEGHFGNSRTYQEGVEHGMCQKFWDTKTDKLVSNTSLTGLTLHKPFWIFLISGR
jgi:hypothetical protein